MEEKILIAAKGAPASEDGEWTLPKLCYAVLTGMLLMSCFYIMLTYKEGAHFTGGTYSLPVFMWILRLASAGMTLMLGRIWKDKGFLILMAYLLLMVVRLLLEDSRRLFALSVSESLLCAIWVYIGCYGMARVLSRRQQKQFIAACAYIWTLGMTAMACTGLYAYWTDQRILNLTGTAYFGVMDYRLTLCYYTNPCAEAVSLSVLIAVIGLLSSKRTGAKLFFGLTGAVLFITLALTVTRTAHVTTGIGLGTMAGILILKRWYDRRGDQDNRSRWKTALVWAAALVTAGIILAGTVLILMRMIPVISGIKTRGGLISAALAEGTGGVEPILPRDYNDSRLNGRVEGWNLILSYLSGNPRLLLTGASIFFPMEGTGAELQHAHCRMLMVVLESGFPGLLLYISFYGYIAVRSVRLMKDREQTLWARLMPAVVISIVLGDLVECLTWLGAGIYPMLPFMFVTMGMISVYGEPKKRTDPADGGEGAER